MDLHGILVAIGKTRGNKQQKGETYTRFLGIPYHSFPVDTGHIEEGEASPVF
jgi:hypothetical protein